MKLIATRKSQQNRAAVDPWTAVHVAAGLAAGLMNVPLRWTIGAGVVYELVEQVFERVPEGQEFFETSGPERVSNALVDVAVLVVGHRLGQWWNRT